jgi:hypothetical protein
MEARGISEPESKLIGDPRWAAVRRVADSPLFTRAALLRDFFLYITSHELSGQTDEITEQKIGHRVYKRNELYSPADDNIVRVSAHQLRLKLREFYETEGKDEPWIIEVPKGKYIPQFRSRNPVEADRTTGTAAGNRRRTWIPATAVLIVVGLMAWLLIDRFAPARPKSPPPNLVASIFKDSNESVEIVTSDEALTLMQSMLGRRFTLEQYTTQSYRDLPPTFKSNPEAEHIWNVLAKRQIMNLGDAEVSNRIRDSLLQRGTGLSVDIRNAQNMRPRDFLSGNFILLGESSSDPWVEMFGEDRFNFQFSPDLAHFPRPILNLHPKPGEQQYYAADLARNLSYARIVYIPNVTNTGHALLIAGTSMEGTEAAAEFCLQPESVSMFLNQLGVGSEQKIPAFEALLLTSSKGGTGIGARVISLRVIQDSSESPQVPEAH